MPQKLHILPELPYAYSALEPYIDAKTMEIHHSKHHQAYVDKLNEALLKYEDLQGKSVEELLINLDAIPEDIRTAVRNNAGGHKNHSMFWQSMAPKTGGEPSGKLAEGIKKTFGSVDEFKKAFNDAGVKRFGSGWVWLVSKDGALSIISTANQDSPIMEGYTPIIGNDVWEHAYYLTYQNKRIEYLTQWWNVVNWQEVGSRLVGK